ncbi:MAG: GNAT family N-acetyltransferase [Pseudomonadota bacterium]
MRSDFSVLQDKKAVLDDWRRLYAQSDARFFLSPAWIDALVVSAPAGKKFAVVRIHDDLRGLYAMAVANVPSPQPFPFVRSARLQESGVEALDRVYLEYNDILVTRSAPDGARDAAVGALLDGMASADQFIFKNADPLLASSVLRAAAARDFAVEEQNLQPTFAIDLEKIDGDSVLASFSSSLRAKIRRSIKRYEERGPVAVTRPKGPAEIAIAWTELMRLHAQTWSRRGKRGVFHERAFCQFHERLIEKNPDNIDFVRLTAGAETIGVLYNFVERGRVYNYQSGFKYESDNQLAPGFVCHALAADEYRASGFSIYDMMGGDADYKRRLGSESGTLTTIVVTKRNLRTRIRSAMKSARNARDAKTHQT